MYIPGTGADIPSYFLNKKHMLIWTFVASLSYLMTLQQFAPFKRIGDQLWPGHKIGHGSARGIYA